MNIDDYLDDEQLKVVGLIGVVIVAMAAGPILLAPSDDNEIEPNKGTVVTPDGTELQEVDSTVDRGPLGGLNAIPTSHLQDDKSPTVYASAGSQTMRVETTTVGGDPALNLSDERTHDGRWVSVPTEWFNQTQGEVPAVARIAHEENGTYTEAIQVRGDSAAFYVRGFSTNTVTFGGELVIRDQPAVDGTRHTYQLESRESVDDIVINATGTTNHKIIALGGSTSGTKSIEIAGNAEPTNGQVSVSMPSTITYGTSSNTGLDFTAPSDAGTQTYSVSVSQTRYDSRNLALGFSHYVNGNEISYNSYEGYLCGDTRVCGGTSFSVELSPGDKLTIDNYHNAKITEATTTVSTSGTTTISTDTGDSVSITDGGSSPIELTENTTELDISQSGDSITSWSLEYNATTVSKNPVVEVNGERTSYTSTLMHGETVSLVANSSWLQDGINNVTIEVGDGSVTNGPEPQIDIEYRHGIESPRAVTYQSEALSEHYNISKTYTTPRANATLTVPHARTVLSMRAVEYRLNETGSWSSVPQSAANLSGTTLNVDISDLAGDPVPEGTTVEVRSTGSRVDAHDSEISVVRATPVGFDMDSRVRLESWNSGSYLEVGETPQGGLVYYAENESYSAESDYVELYSDGSQRFYAPNASSGSELTLNTLSARVEPDRNSMRVRVPESTNATNTEFVVEPASVVGDAWTAEYVAGTDGQWYAAVDSSGTELGAAEKPDPIEVSRDDVGFVSIEPTEPPSASTSGAGGGVFATFTNGNLPSLLVLFGGVGMLFVAGTRPRSSKDAIDGIAGGVASLISRVPRIGEPVGSAVEGALSAAGSGLVSVGENRLLTGTIGAAVAVAAAEAGLFSIGAEAGAIIAVAGIAVGSLFLLREADAFTTARWIAIVGVAGVVALQGLGEDDVLTELVNSDAFLIVVLIAGYAAIQLVREYRANNSPDDDRPQIVIGGKVGSDDEGSD